MPPVRSRRVYIKSAATRARTGKKYFRINYNSSKPTHYRTYTKAKNGMKMLRIATNVPKASDIRLRYNQTILLKGNTEEQYRFRIQMNNPDGNGTADLISEISGAPTIATNTAQNLSLQMNDLFDQYDHAVVVESNLKCNIRPFGNNAGTGVTYTTVTDPTSGNWSLQSAPADTHGDLMAWAVLSDRTNAFVSDVIPVATLRNDTPGVKQKSLMCYNNLRKGVEFKQKYNPRAQFGIKDIGDNQTRLGFSQTSGPNEKIFADIGIQPVIPHTIVGDGPEKMPDLYVTFAIDYKIRFTERRPQANVARPVEAHTEL